MHVAPTPSVDSPGPSEHAVSDAGHSAGPPAVLAAVRKAGASLTGGYQLASPSFVRAQRRLFRIASDLDEVKERLDAWLYDLVPQQPDTGRRRAVLQLKRSIFNERSVPDWAARRNEACETPSEPPSDTPSPTAPARSDLPADVATLLDRYQSLLDERSDLIRETIATVPDQQRAVLTDLIGQPRFRAAVEYASPSLWRAVRRARGASGPAFASGPPDRPFSKLDTSLYAYAARFTGKANPLHLFAETALPGTDADALQVERLRSVQHLVADDARRLDEANERGEATDPFLAAAPHRIREDDVLVALGAGRPDRRFARLGLNPLLTFVLSRLSTGARRRSDVLAAAGTAFGSAVTESKLTRYLDTLVHNGVLEAYLTDDLHRAAVLGLASVAADVDGFPAHQRHAESDAEREVPASEGGPVYVNAYTALPPVPGPLCEAVADDLRALRPLFVPFHNFARHDAVLRRVVADALVASGGEIDYVDLLQIVARRRRDDRLPAAPDVPTGRLRVLSAASGTLSDDDLAELTDAHTSDRSDTHRALCFNGPLDVSTGTFYPSNVWDGDGHFTSRYQPDRDRVPSSQRDAEPVTVQIYGPVGLDANYTAVVCRTGFNLRGRYRSLFDHWLSPADLVVRAGEEGAVQYVDRRTGRAVQFRYVGFAQSHGLPFEYQLLLLGHADVFSNPFDAPVAETEDALPDDDVFVRPGLRYGSVVLRRERVYVRTAAVPEQEGGEPFVAYALRLAAWMQRAVPDAGTAGDRLYFRTPSESHDWKPRLLDLASPLSIASFTRRLRAADAGDRIVLERMQPDVPGLVEIDGAPFVTEMMLEI